MYSYGMLYIRYSHTDSDPDSESRFFKFANLNYRTLSSLYLQYGGDGEGLEVGI